MEERSIIDQLKGLLDGFDPTAFLPDLSGMSGWVELMMRLSVLVGPLVMLAFGLVYFLTPTPEANYDLGYRTHRGMASVESWRFTQLVAGGIWTVTGLVLTIVMGVQSSGFRDMEMMDMTFAAIRLLLWQAGVVAVCYGVIWLLVIIFFDRKGVARRFWHRA